MIREEEGGPLYRNQRGGKSHIKPMWDSYLEKTTASSFQNASHPLEHKLFESLLTYQNFNLIYDIKNE